MRYLLFFFVIILALVFLKYVIKYIIGVLIFVVIMLVFVVYYTLTLDTNQHKEKESKKQQMYANWNSLNKGDSLFMLHSERRISFYKKGREELDEYDQKSINYARSDTANFFKQNSIHEKFFYKNKTFFIGICIGKDSSITKAGKHCHNLWVMVKPNKKIINITDTDEFEYGINKWQDNYEDYRSVSRLSHNFYVKFMDISIINNDSIFLDN